MHLEVLIQVEPSSISACLAVVAIREDPAKLRFDNAVHNCLLLCERDTGLVLRQKFVIDSYIAIGCPTNDNFFVHALIFVVVNFSSRWSTENFQFQVRIFVIAVEIKVWGNVNLCLHLPIWVLCITIEQVLVLRKLRPIKDVDNNIGFTNID